MLRRRLAGCAPEQARAVALGLLLVLMGLLSCSGSTSRQPRRFFSDESFWNQPIPENPEIDPRSERWIAALETEPTGENFGISYREWTIPVYETDSTVAPVVVKRHVLTEAERREWRPGPFRAFGHSPDFDRGVPIPPHALPDPAGDAHLALVDWDRMLAWDMWGARRLPDGSWESKTGMVYRLDGPGVFDTDQLGVRDSLSVHFYGPGRASGVPAIAGLIRWEEVQAGEIRHKLACATRFAAYREFVFPAAWTDGPVVGGIPEGAVIQLDPDLDLSRFDLTPGELVVARALQRYGMVVVDWAEGQPIYAEGLYGHPDRSWEGILRSWEGGINTIPYRHYRVLKVKNPVYRGDVHLRRKLLRLKAEGKYHAATELE